MRVSARPSRLPSPHAPADQSEAFLNNDGVDSASFSDPNDPFLSRQWHLSAINADSVWSDYTGKGVKVGIVDDGFDYLHPDLAANYRTDLDYDAIGRDNDAYSSASGDKHGTAVAGIIGADIDNGVGGAGVAPKASLIGYRIGFGSNGTSSALADALSRQVQVDVSNNSWGYSTPFQDNFNQSSFASMASSINNAVTNGRGELGTVFVFAAANYRSSGDNVNYHNFQNSPDTIAVGSLSSRGTYASYSNPGAALLISAPGVSIYTTDRVGKAGYSSGDYTYFGGTSAAAPVVSGVVALMLEANPELGYRDVQEILAFSARNPVASDRGWQTNGADTWNGGGLTVSHDYGFGQVDALAAVRLAETWHAQSTKANLQTVSQTSSPSQVIKAGGTITNSITFSDADLSLDQIQVALNISHGYRGALIVTLTSPSGTTSTLIDKPGNGRDSGQNIVFTLSSVQFWGEDPNGTWTIEVTNTSSSVAGRLNSWKLSLLGDVASDDTVYIFTDEYGTLADHAERRDLEDSSGVDTLNLAAVTGDIVLDLAPGATSMVAGRPLTISPDTIIENAILGDGNDIVVGNMQDNMLMGGRGNDILYGGGGYNTAVYLGDFADFEVTLRLDYSITVNFIGDSGIDEGFDTLFDIDALLFNTVLYHVGDLFDFTVPVTDDGSDDIVADDGDGDVIADGGDGDTVADDDDGDVIADGGDGDTVADDDDGDTVADGDDGDTVADGDDTMTKVVGTEGRDSLRGSEAADHLVGLGGNDTLYGFGGNDTLEGGDGDDRLFGGDGDDILMGGSGDDRLYGDDGDDILIGGPGSNQLYGGNGRDTFRFESFDWGSGDQDTIFDFARGEDVVDFRDLLASLGYTGSDPVADGYVDQIFDSRSRTVELRVDPDGADGAADFETIVLVRGMQDHLDLGTDVLLLA